MRQNEIRKIHAGQNYTRDEIHMRRITHETNHTRQSQDYKRGKIHTGQNYTRDKIHMR